MPVFVARREGLREPVHAGCLAQQRATRPLSRLRAMLLIKGQTQESPSVPVTGGSRPARIRDFFPGVEEAGDTSLQNFV